MPLLNNNKPILLNQVKRGGPAVDINQLVKLLNLYEDLKIEDFKGVISETQYEQLQDAYRDPRELELWNRITTSPKSNVGEVQALQRLIDQYLAAFSNSPKAQEAQTMKDNLVYEMEEMERRRREEEEIKREQSQWDNLDKNSYTALQAYRSMYPQSVHLGELDDLMWNYVVGSGVNSNSLNRYLNDWPLGKHSTEANEALSQITEWEEVKRSGELLDVCIYRSKHPASPFSRDVNSIYFNLREKTMKDMKKNPSEFGKDEVEQLLEYGAFTLYELQDEGLITDESLETLHLDRELFPNIQDYQIEDPNISAPEGCTDIYLFGTPGTGKTCLLMGLTGADGKGFSLNMKLAGGPYASALQQYVNAGITPGRTFGKFVTTINGKVNEEDNKGRIFDHHINLVEMSGEEFALRIADNMEVSLANMGTGATNLLMNNNKKVFFIIVDSSKDSVKVEYIEQVKDADGNVVDERIRKKYISQLDILNKFISLFELPENQEIMKSVDAIHFVVTKADMLGCPGERGKKARELLLEKYSGPVEKLKAYCRTTRRINYSTNSELRYRPMVFTFSLGKFYLGDVFKFDPSETMQIVDAIRSVTGCSKETTWWDKFKKVFG